MEDNRIIELDRKIEQLQIDNSEIYTWISLKESQTFLNKEINSNDSARNTNKNKKELIETEECIKFMKRNFSSVTLYDELISEKEKILEKNSINN